MRRLLQLATLLFVAAAILAPLAECLDSWDPPGLSSDTEFALFAILLTLCLVLLVASLIAFMALLVQLIARRNARGPDAAGSPAWLTSAFCVRPPPLLHTLRI